MKKRTRRILSIVLCMLFALMATMPAMASELEDWDVSEPLDTFAWTNGASVSGSTRVDSGVNSLGQSFYRFYNNGNLEVEIFTRNGNVWNNTTQTLLTTSNKDAGSLMIDSSYNVYGVSSQVVQSGRTLNDVAVQYDRYFTSDSTPRYLTEHPGVTGFQTDSNGIGIGIYTADGLYSIAEDRIVSNNSIFNNNNWNNNSNYRPNYNSNSSYPRIIQSKDRYDNKYEYYTSNQLKYTYTLSSNGVLSYGGRTIASNVNEDMQCGINDYLVFTKDRQACIVKVGTTSVNVLCNNFAEYIYDGSSYNRVIGAEDTSGNQYWIDGHYWCDTDGDYFYDPDDDDYRFDDYPIVHQNGDYQYYLAEPNDVYTYRLTDGKLYYSDKNGRETFIAEKVDEIAFADGYMIYVVSTGNSWNPSQTAKVTRIGSTRVIKTYSNFEYFEQDDNNLVTEIVANSRSYDADDWD